MPPPPKRQLHLADSPADRQHRRKTWAERLAANALPAKATVSVTFARYGHSKLVSPLSDATRKTA